MLKHLKLATIVQTIWGGLLFQASTNIFKGKWSRRTSFPGILVPRTNFLPDQNFHDMTTCGTISHHLNHHLANTMLAHPISDIWSTQTVLSVHHAFKGKITLRYSSHAAYQMCLCDPLSADVIALRMAAPVVPVCCARFAG